MTLGEILDEGSLKRLREARTVTASVSASEVIGTTLPEEEKTVEPLKPVPPGEAHKRGLDTVLKSFVDDPVRFGLLCDLVRLQQPEFRLFSNDQLSSMVRALYDEAIRKATDEAFHKLGRGKELQIKTEGY